MISRTERVPFVYAAACPADQAVATVLEKTRCRCPYQICCLLWGEGDTLKSGRSGLKEQPTTTEEHSNTTEQIYVPRPSAGENEAWSDRPREVAVLGGGVTGL